MLVSFPFTDLRGARLRPALVIGRPMRGDVILAFVTSRDIEPGGPSDCALATADSEFAMTGLKVASHIRLDKIATLHRALVRRRLGRIGPRTRGAVDVALRFVLDL